MNSQEVMETELWAYIDNICDEAERVRIAGLIATNTEWKEKHEELLTLHHSLKAIEPEHTSMRFSKNVIEAIADVKLARATGSYVNPWIIRGIITFFLLLVGGAIIYSISNIQWTAAEPGKSLSYSSIFNDKFVMYVVLANLLVGIVLVDTLLRRKKKTTN